MSLPSWLILVVVLSSSAMAFDVFRRLRLRCMLDLCVLRLFVLVVLIVLKEMPSTSVYFVCASLSIRGGGGGGGVGAGGCGNGVSESDVG